MDLSPAARRLIILAFVRHLPGILWMLAEEKLRESLLNFAGDDGKLQT